MGLYTARKVKKVGDGLGAAARPGGEPLPRIPAERGGSALFARRSPHFRPARLPLPGAGRCPAGRRAWAGMGSGTAGPATCGGCALRAAAFPACHDFISCFWVRLVLPGTDVPVCRAQAPASSESLQPGGRRVNSSLRGRVPRTGEGVIPLTAATRNPSCPKQDVAPCAQ